jgi:hypothetical protein
VSIHTLAAGRRRPRAVQSLPVLSRKKAFSDNKKITIEKNEESQFAHNGLRNPFSSLE